MNRLARILAIVLLAVFAAGTVAHATQATSMSLAMSVSTMGEGGMGDCDACPLEGGKAPVCGQACMAPFAAIPAAAGIELPFVAAGIASSPLKAPDGFIRSPDHSPPRTIFLN
jgi:hypothetical protein